MEGQSSLRKQTKFSRIILCSNRRILQSPRPNEHPDPRNQQVLYEKGKKKPRKARECMKNFLQLFKKMVVSLQ